MTEPKFIHCEEIAVDPIIITLGDKVQVDVSKISAYNTARTIQIIQKTREGTANPQDATNLVLDIIREQGGEATEDDLMKAGNQVQLNAFVTAIVKYTLDVYAPLKQKDAAPFRPPAGQPETKESS